MPTADACQSPIQDRGLTRISTSRSVFSPAKVCPRDTKKGNGISQPCGLAEWDLRLLGYDHDSVFAFTNQTLPASAPRRARATEASYRRFATNTRL